MNIEQHEKLYPGCGQAQDSLSQAEAALLLADLTTAVMSGKGKITMKMPGSKPEPESALSVQEGGDHYKRMVIQPVEFIHKNQIPFIEGCCIKYLCRWRAKGGVQDLRKVKHFVDLLIEMEHGYEQSPVR